jgi:hypothetical protein
MQAASSSALQYLLELRQLLVNECCLLIEKLVGETRWLKEGHHKQRAASIGNDTRWHCPIGIWRNEIMV